MQSALLEACKAHDWLLLAPQLPGRGQRMREQPINTLQVTNELRLWLASGHLYDDDLWVPTCGTRVKSWDSPVTRACKLLMAPCLPVCASLHFTAWHVASA